jgi:HNH endonuclease
MIGLKFNRWTVAAYSHRSPNQGPFWFCICDCGTKRVVRGSSLKNNHSQSCGCYNRDLQHARNHPVGENELSLPGEIWAPLPSTVRETLVEASSFGRLRQMPTTHVYSPVLDENGYLRVSINGKLIRAHRLVALAFHPNPLNLPQINHKDANKSNNAPSNLEWCTPQGNMHHAHALGLVPALLGEDNGASKLTEKEVKTIRSRYIPGIVRQVDLAAEFDVSQRTISLIVRREKWTHV